MFENDVQPYPSNGYQRNGYVDQYGKGINKDVDQWFTRGIQQIDKPKKGFCSNRTLCYIISSIICLIIVLSAILIPLLWSLFNQVKTTSPTTISTTLVPLSSIEYLWSFDGSFQDWTSTYNGQPSNSPTISSITTITGYGSSLSLSSSSSQSVYISSPFLNLSNSSWTFECWIYLLSFSSTDNSIIGQCQLVGVQDRCLHLIIRNGHLYMGFYGDDIQGSTSLSLSQWYHVAFVFNSINKNQSVYLNGLLDGTGIAGNCYLGNNGSLTIGTTNVNIGSNYFNGYIDQLDYINRVKSSTEILNDGTLSLYYSFDSGSIIDQSSMRINGTSFGIIYILSGRINNAIQLGSNGISYISISNLILLGQSNRSYSFSIWLNPSSLTGSSILHYSTLSTGLGTCFGILGISSTGQIIAYSLSLTSIYINGPLLIINSWTHIGITYSLINGLRLYINGILFNSTLSYSSIGIGSLYYLRIGQSLSGTSCPQSPILPGQYSGLIDEFRIYSRELLLIDIYSLANP